MARDILVIYHRADFDGKFCYQIAKRFFGDKANYLGWDYGDTLPVIEPDIKEIYMLDISVDGLMNDPRLIWIDHHKSAIDKYVTPKVPRGYCIDGVAACRLAYQYFFTYNCVRNPMAEPDKTLPTKEEFIDRKVQEPLAVRLAGEYDIWDRRDPRAELFQHGLRAFDLESHWKFMLELNRVTPIKEIESLVDAGVQYILEPDGTSPPAIVFGILEAGRGLQYAKQHEDASIIKSYGFTLVWEGLTFLACNHARFNSHLFDAGLTPDHQACLGFNWDGANHRWRFSLYHAPGKEEYDLSLIAVKHGGGGHRGACGFVCNELPFTL